MSACIIVRYRRYGARSTSEAEDRSFRTLAPACSRCGLSPVDHLVVVTTGEYGSTFYGGP